MAHQQPQPSLRVDDVALRAVVHGVAVAALRLLEEDLVLGGGFLRRVQVTAQRNEARVECGHVLGERLGRVALGIDAHHQHLHALGVGA